MSEATNDKKAGRLIPRSLMALALVAFVTPAGAQIYGRAAGSIATRLRACPTRPGHSPSLSSQHSPCRELAAPASKPAFNETRDRKRVRSDSGPKTILSRHRHVPWGAFH